MRQTTDRTAPRVRRCGAGFSAEGPGFFVWDRDSSAVADAALLLARGAVPARTPERLFLRHGRSRTSADAEALDD